MIYGCVLTVYNTLYRFVKTQRYGFCQKTDGNRYLVFQPAVINLLKQQ